MVQLYLFGPLVILFKIFFFLIFKETNDAVPDIRVKFLCRIETNITPPHLTHKHGTVCLAVWWSSRPLSLISTVATSLKHLKNHIQMLIISWGLSRLCLKSFNGLSTVYFFPLLLAFFSVLFFPCSCGQCQIILSKAHYQRVLCLRLLWDGESSLLCHYWQNL